MRALALFLFLSAAPPEPQEAHLGWHVVKPGETLESITAHYLGDRRRWPENHRLNPDVKNVYALRPGSRLRVILPAPRTAAIRKAERSVEKKPQPQPWVKAQAGDALRQKDGVRTFAKSSAELAFDDGTELILTESSVLFLREMSLPLPGPRRDALEVVEGQVDLVARPVREAPSSLEIVMGNATATPKGVANEPPLARARLAKAGDAQLMVYRGQSDLLAAGTSVRVPKGMGTSAGKDGPPRPPEKLLPAPRALRPEEGAALAYANPGFAWDVVPGAAGYVLEVCRDAGCAQLVARATDVKEPRHAFGALPPSAYHWRVSAVAPSGLDGYASDPRALRVGDASDEEPPVVVAFALGERQASETEIVIGLGSTLLLEAQDDLSGVAEVRHRWDGGAWVASRGGPVVVPSGSSHRLEFAALDRAGNLSTVHGLTVRWKE